MSLHYLWQREPHKLSLFMLGIRRDHPRRRIERKFCVVAGLLIFEFYQNRLTVFGAAGGRSLPFAIDLAVFPLI